MQLRFLDPSSPFPATSESWPDGSEAPGLLAACADLSVKRLRSAYALGIFPWYSEGQPVLWWAPDPRMVLKVAEFKLSPSLRKTLRKVARSNTVEIRVDHDFERIIRACALTRREHQPGTWILPEMIQSYCEMHRAGLAHSIETWIDGELSGGLYATSLGRMVFGESMFTWKTDASKIALAALVAICRREHIDWIDCQQQTEHLARLGAAPIRRQDFEQHLRRTVNEPPADLWKFDRTDWRQLELSAQPIAADNSP